MMAGRRSRNSLFNSRYLCGGPAERARTTGTKQNMTYLERLYKRLYKNILLMQKYKSRRLIKIDHLNSFKGGRSHPQAQRIPQWAPSA